MTDDEEEEARIEPYTKSKSGPQGGMFEPVLKRHRKMIFVPGKGQVPDPDDIAEDMLYDINQAIVDFEAETQRRKSFANVGYSSLKKRG